MKQIFLILFFIPFLIYGSEFSASIKPSAMKVSVDEPLSIEVTLRYPEDYYPDTDVMVANLLERGTLAQPPFTFVGLKMLSHEVLEGVVNEVIQFELDPQVLGNHQLTFFGIPFYLKESKDGKFVELISTVFNVQVFAAPSDPNYRGVIAPLLTFDKAYPITPGLENRKLLMDYSSDQLAPINLQLWNEKQIPWIAIGTFLLLALIGYFTILKPRPETAEQRAIRARKEALQTLETLRQKRLPQLAQFESYYIELTDAVRNYFEAYYNLSAPTQTTREFLQDLADHHFFDQETQKNLKEFLVRSDLVKFAQYIPSKDECAYAEIAAKKVISP